MGDGLRGLNRRFEDYGHTGPQVAVLLAVLWFPLLGLSLLVVRSNPLNALLPLIAGVLATALVLSKSRWRGSRRTGG